MTTLNLTQAQKLYYGNTEVQKLYKGNQLIYSSNRTDPYADNVVLYLKGDNFADSSSNPKIITVNGNVTVSNQQGKNSLNFGYRNSSNYLSIPMSSDFHLTGDFTIELWSFCNDTSQNEVAHRIIDTRELGEFSSEGYQLMLYENCLQFWTGSYSASFALIKSSTTPPLNQWNHLAFTRFQNINRLFINGVKVAENTINWIHSLNTNNLLTIGKLVGIESYFSGYLNSLKITKGIARYTENFNIETETFLD